MPPTIQALLAERLDRLTSEEREILECGAVEGEVFHRSSCAALSARRAHEAELDSLLTALVRKELIRPHPATFRDDHAFRFRHLLIRDAAYDALPKGNRADLHEKFARLAGAHRRPRLVELDEIAGWHLEQPCATAENSAETSIPRWRAGPPTICTRPADAPASAATWQPQETCSSALSWRQRRSRAVCGSALTSPSC